MSILLPISSIENCDKVQTFSRSCGEIQILHFFMNFKIIFPNRISAHRCIMAAASPYFTAMFANNFNESKQREVIIQDVNADDFEFLIEFCYSATIHVNNENAKRILQAAHCFQFPDIINACGQYLKGQMNPSICLGIANLAEYLDLKDLHQSAMEFAYQNFVGVSKNDEFMLLDIQTLSHLLQRNDLVVCTEEDVFRAMLTWIQYDIEDREKFTGDLLKMIRLTRLNIAVSGYVSGLCFSFKKIVF